MTQYFRKVMCSDRLPNKRDIYNTNVGRIYFYKRGEYNWATELGIFLYNPPEWWLEPIEEPLYTKSDMLSCWDAALSHALKLKGYYKTFYGFIKSLKK